MRHTSISIATATLLLPAAVLAWSGDTWAPISRATIKANADLMIESTWIPKNTFTNFQYGSTYKTYTKGTSYKGIAYSQNNPQENWPQFENLVTNTSGGSVGYGNDCSGFVSICWRLPARYTTASFESQLGTYWTSLGNIGSSASVALSPGDAINRASSHIILFLNYEGAGLRSMEQTPDNAQRRLWSYSSLANYRPIRRLQITDSPMISSDGVRRVVDTGKSVTFSITATGTAPLSYQWKFNGNNIPGATADRLTIPAAQATNAGSYLCVVANASGSVTSRVMNLMVYPPQETVFVDTFDTDTAANWALNRSSADTRVAFSFNYAGMGVPAAPSSGGTTRGLRMEANLGAGALAALSLSPKNQAFTGDYRLRFDMWINVNGPLPDGGTGSTEFLTAGLGTAGNRVHWTGSGSTADGMWFSVSGEGGASETSTSTGDFCAYLGTTLQNPAAGCYLAGNDTSAKGNNNAYYLAAFPDGSSPPAWQRNNFPQQTGTTAAGTIGMAWREVIVSRRGNVVDWSIDGVRLVSITNASMAAGNVFVGYWDNYTSISDNTNLSFGLVDNVRVEVPATAPTIVSQPEGAAKWVGGNVSFSVDAIGTLPLSYAWQLNGTNLPGATGHTLDIASVQFRNAGVYTVIVSNIAGRVTSSGAVLSVQEPVPPRLVGISLRPDGKLELSADCLPGQYTVQMSSNLVDWVEAGEFTAPGTTSHLLDINTQSDRWFYRLRWVP
jgi:hypothetical protein